MTERRLELLKMEGTGFNRNEIVKQLSEKFQCTERAVYYDFQHRTRWQPALQQLKDNDKILMKIINRYEQIYRKASFKALTTENESVHLGALKVMLEANSKISEAMLIPELAARMEVLEEKAEKVLKTTGVHHL